MPLSFLAIDLLVINSDWTYFAELRLHNWYWSRQLYFIMYNNFLSFWEKSRNQAKQDMTEKTLYLFLYIISTPVPKNISVGETGH